MRHLQPSSGGRGAGCLRAVVADGGDHGAGVSHWGADSHSLTVFGSRSSCWHLELKHRSEPHWCSFCMPHFSRGLSANRAAMIAAIRHDCRAGNLPRARRWMD